MVNRNKGAFAVQPCCDCVLGCLGVDSCLSFNAKSLSLDDNGTVDSSVLSVRIRDWNLSRLKSDSPYYSPTRSNDPKYIDASNQDRDSTNDYPFEFAACLLTKDDKIILPEWLAYHYTVMPLRRLIVAIDPLSITSPEPVLELWNNHTNLKITTWTGNWYWKISEWKDPTTLNKMPPKGDKIIDDTKLLRQSSFYTNCLQLL